MTQKVESPTTATYWGLNPKTNKYQQRPLSMAIYDTKEIDQMADTSRKRLSDHTDMEPTSHSLDELLGQEVVVQGVDFIPGEYGEFAVMKIVLPTGEIWRVRSGATIVMDALRNADSSNAFPLDATFKRVGRMYDVD